MKKTLAILLAVVLVLVAMIFAFQKKEVQKESAIENAGVAQNAAVKQEYLTYQGKNYPLKSHLQTVLLIGTDATEGYRDETDESGLKAFYNYHQADFMMVLVMDTDNNKLNILQMNRDTMTDVPWLDVLGNYGGTEYKQLCLAYNYGDGGMKSCKNAVQAVSTLLFDAPIDHYIQIPMTAVGTLNDLVGGVPVTIEEDMTAVDPAFTAGSTVLLKGSQAEAFVRARYVLENDTNLARMKRQRQYMDSFQVQARKAFDSDSEFMVKLIGKLSDFLQSDLTAQQMSSFLTMLDKAEVSPIRYPEGQLKKGEEYYEFYPEEASLWDMVKEAYCIPD